MSDVVNCNGLEFQIFMRSNQIQSRVHVLAEQIDKEYNADNTIAIVVMNGAFVFAADLLRLCKQDFRIEFVKASSYKGMIHDADIQLEFTQGLDCIEGKHVLVIEDILDSGNTLFMLEKELVKHNPLSIEICSLLVKPESLRQDLRIKYRGFDIPQAFVIGYGLDYEGFGRGFPDIYQLKA